MDEEDTILEHARNICCSEDVWQRVMLYACGLSHEPYACMSAKNKHFVHEMYLHIHQCSDCHGGYDYFKEQLANGEYPEVNSDFTQESFRIWRENEKTLDALLVTNPS